jgi:hypothetical protein
MICAMRAIAGKDWLLVMLGLSKMKGCGMGAFALLFER